MINKLGPRHISSLFLQFACTLSCTLLPATSSIAQTAPEPATPFTQSTIEFPGGAEGVTLAATLLLPAGASETAPVPGVVLITGSGPQDRDETIMGKKPFKILAEGLAATGFAVLRYDDRGTKDLKIGQSTGSFTTSTLADFSTDAAAALTHLAAHPAVADDRIVICGHSTGGLETAMLLGQHKPAAAAILLASPAVSGGTLLIHQSADILNAMHAIGQSGMNDQQVADLNQVQRDLIESHIARDQEKLKAAAERAVRITLASRMPQGNEITDEMLALGIKQATAQLENKWMDHFIRYDPHTDLASSKVPVLAIYGGRDLQVTPALNAGPASTAIAKAGSSHSMVVVLPTLNHLFQEADSGLPNEYANLTGEMPPRLINLISEWLNEALKNPTP